MPAALDSRFPLHNMIVVDTSDTLAGAYTSKLLCDAGAEVIKIERNKGDKLRQWKASACLGLSDELAPGEDGALFQYLNSNKKSLLYSKESGARKFGEEELVSLLSKADLLLIDERSATLEDLGTSLDNITNANQQLSIISISNYGVEFKNNQLCSAGMPPANEFTLQAAVGATDFRGYPDRVPLAAGGQLGEYIGGSFAAVAALAAWMKQRATNTGQIVDVSLFESMLLSMQPYQFIHGQLDPDVPFPRSVEVPSIAKTKNGWVGFCTITQQQWHSLAEAMERPDLAEYDEQAKRYAEVEKVVDGLNQWCAAHTTEEILALTEKHRVPAAPVCDGESILGIDHLQQRGVYVEHPGGFKQPRVPYQLSRSSTRPVGPAPTVGQDNGHWQQLVDRPARPSSSDVSQDKLPLQGKRVLDLTAFWAGPVAASCFAALGAEVIKVESIQRPDGMRFASGLFPPDKPIWEISCVTHGANAGKKDLTLDLGSDKGRQLLTDLIKQSDILVENFAPRVMEKYGFSWPEVEAINPQIIMMRMPAFGLDGPWRDRVGFAMTIEQVSGMAMATGYPDREPLVPRGCVDPLGGMHAVFAALAAVVEREHSGKGQLIEVPLLEAGLNITAEQVIEHTAYGVSLSRLGNRGPAAVPQGVYTGSDGELLAIAIEDDAQWRALLEVMSAGGLQAYASNNWQQRRQNEQAIDNALQRCAEQQSAADWVGALQAAGIPASLLPNARILQHDPILAQRHFFHRMPHAIVEELDYPNFPFRFNNEYLDLKRPAPLLGEHNHEILGELLGLNDEEIQQLETDQVIGVKPVFM